MDNYPAVLLGYALRVYFRVSFSMVRDVLVLISVHVVGFLFGCTCPDPFLCPLFCIPTHCLQAGLPHILEKMTALALLCNGVCSDEGSQKLPKCNDRRS